MKKLFILILIAASVSANAQTVGAGVFEIRRSLLDTPSYLNGSQLRFSSLASDYNPYKSNEIISTWTTPTFGSRVSNLTITGVNNTTSQNILSLSGAGQLTLNQYTGTNFNTAQAKVAMFGTDGKIYAVDTTGLFGGGGGGTLPTLAQYHLYVGDASSIPVDGGTGITYNGTSLLLNGASTSYNNVITALDRTKSQGRFYGSTPTTGNTAGTLNIDNTISNGAIALGNSVNFQGWIGYDSRGNTILTIGNTWDNASSEINFKLRTFSAANAITALRLLGSGYINIPTTPASGASADSVLVRASDGTVKIRNASAFGISGITADNGLTASTSTNVQLGSASAGSGSLFTANRYINTDTYQAVFYGIGVSGATLEAINTTNQAIFGHSTDGAGVAAQSINVEAFSGGVIPSSTNTTVPIAVLTRGTSGTAANNIGGSLDFYIEADNGTNYLSNQVISKFTTSANATRTSQFSITGVASGTTNTILSINAGGALVHTVDVDIASSPTSHGLSATSNYFQVYDGTNTGTYTLPAISGNTGMTLVFKNTNSGTLTINSNSGSNEIYTTTAVNTLSLSTGQSAILINTGTYWAKIN